MKLSPLVAVVGIAPTRWLNELPQRTYLRIPSWQALRLRGTGTVFFSISGLFLVDTVPLLRSVNSDIMRPRSANCLVDKLWTETSL